MESIWAELYPIASNIEEAGTQEPLAVFTSYYSDNEDRINNLAVACKYISKVMKPGESMNFNHTAGPFTAEEAAADTFCSVTIRAGKPAVDRQFDHFPSELCFQPGIHSIH